MMLPCVVNCRCHSARVNSGVGRLTMRYLSMNDAGYIYVLINPSMNGLTKVGKTSRNPEDRVRELSKVTGIPTPFILAFDVYLDNCSQAEEYVHMVLEQRGYRVASNREFFDAPLNEVIKVVLEAQNIFSGNITSDEMSDYSDLDEDEDCFPNTLQIQAREYWKDVLREAEAYYFGEGDTLQDYSEAVKLFKQAAKLGSVSAYLYLGQMYFKGEDAQRMRKKHWNISRKGQKEGTADVLPKWEFCLPPLVILTILRSLGKSILKAK